MRKKILDILRCIQCSASDWDLEILHENHEEVREGKLRCRSCHRICDISSGILNVLGDALPEEISLEKEHAESLGYLVTESGEKYLINQETIDRFRGLFLSLPAGNGSRFFKSGGSFSNQAGNAERFFKTLESLQLTGKERVLEVGASFGWGSWRFAQRGCEVIAVDITNYLLASNLYIEEDGSYFERVMADMNKLPFKNECCDLIFSHSAIHHCKNLERLFSEFYRLLRPGGRAVALHECAFGVFETKSGKALQHAIQEGFNENAYTLSEWKKGARRGGFEDVRLHFFSFIDDYVTRKRMKKSSLSLKLRLAQWIQSHPCIHDVVYWLTIPPRILFRPKAWMLIATKSQR
ncbi:MAG: methyltransferase domain-containing protein [Candidatus Omnitrophica bacterium]|nr:methyltransferase domain-containing protein [Candidatus Omnitrophota bacterium]